MDSWGFMTLLLPHLCMLEIFHNKLFFKIKLIHTELTKRMFIVSDRGKQNYLNVYKGKLGKLIIIDVYIYLQN